MARPSRRECKTARTASVQWTGRLDHLLFGVVPVPRGLYLSTWPSHPNILSIPADIQYVLKTSGVYSNPGGFTGGITGTNGRVIVMKIVFFARPFPTLVDFGGLTPVHHDGKRARRASTPKIRSVVSSELPLAILKRIALRLLCVGKSHRLGTEESQSGFESHRVKEAVIARQIN